MTAHENRGEGDGFRLQVPVDLSDVEALREEKPQELLAVGKLPDGTTVSAPVKIEGCEGVAVLSFEEQPDSVGIYFGPKRATPEELVQSQTITRNVSGEQWDETPEGALDPIRIPPSYWHWWYRWCREFTITGRLVCPDGSPVPGATVCAKDVDSWFFWSSTEELACDTTDEHGAFEIEFRWCCGFWPEWWLERRTWRPEPGLVERVQENVLADSDVSLGRAGSQPSLDVFEGLIDDRPEPGKASLSDLDPDHLEQVRTQLVDRLPDVPDLRQRNVWPWAPWQPWWDCEPDVIFEATQAGEVVLDEGIEDARWDVSTSEDVVLTATEEAQCRGDCKKPPCPDGECLLVTKVCGATIDTVGGNLGAPATPEGYRSPGGADRPYAGTVKLFRNPGTLHNVDYLGFEYDDGTGWAPVPHAALQNFQRHYFDSTKPISAAFGDVPFDFRTIDGQYVIPTREYFEGESSLSWGSNAFWLNHRNLLVPINTEVFDDGTYRFRVIGWNETGGGEELTDRRVLDRCGEETEGTVEIVLTVDNRANPDPNHPAAHPSGPGTVHTPVTEPDTAILAVRVDGKEVSEDSADECPKIEPKPDTPPGQRTLEIDFLAHDEVDPVNPTGHLSHYTLRATYGRNQSVNLLDPAKRTSLDGLPMGPSPPPYVGPTYKEALTQGASRPNWEGGRYRLKIPLDEAFKKPCCYQLELRAYKRTIVNCSGPNTHQNRSEYSISYALCGESDDGDSEE
jgi:hypothetical protein